MNFEGVVLEKDLIERALARASATPILPGSHRGRDANLVGAIGELLFIEFMARHEISCLDQTNRTDWDFLVSGKYTVDVKTKDRTVPPRAHYDCSAPDYNHDHQQPSFLFFVSLQRNKRADNSNPYRFTHGYLLGGIGMKRFKEAAVFWPAGRTDPSNGTTFWTACWNITASKLTPPRDIAVFLSRQEAHASAPPPALPHVHHSPWKRLSGWFSVS